MAQYPIKMLKDENGAPFVPLVAPEAVKDNQGTNWQALIDKKLEKTNIVAGDNITLSVSGNDITINSQADGTTDYSDLTNKPKINNVELSGNKSLSDLGITNFSGDYNDLSNKPDIPTKTSDLTNDSGFIDSSYHDNTKQDTLVSGTNIKTINNESILGEGNISISGGSSLNNVLDGNAIGSARTIGAKDSEGQPLGEYAWAEGQGTIASGKRSHAEGTNTTASGDCSHAEGDSTKASSHGSHAEGGNQTKASGPFSHAEGQTTEASGSNSHAEGSSTKATQSCAHAEGNYTTASGVSSHAEGYGTTASGDSQHVQGKYNISDTTSAHIVGNGAFQKNSNAHTLDWQGNAWFAGDVYTGSTSGKNKDGGSKKLATEEFVTNLVGNVESGSNTNGSWTKWADGTMIINKTVLGTANITNAWGSLYISADINLGDFPVPFIEIPTIVVSPQTQTGTQYMLIGQGGSGYGTETNAGNVALVRPNSRTDVAYRLEVIAKGKWK